MTLSPTTSRGGGPAGVSSGTIIQTGANSPLNVVTPSQKGALYQDTTNGALYVAISAASAGWVAVGGVATADGVSSQIRQGVSTGTDGALYLVSKAAFSVTIGDGLSPSSGTGNSIIWNWGELPDGQQDLLVALGPTGNLYHYWAADGTYSLAAPATGPTHAPRLNQLSPKATITSGALPTATLSSGTGAQVSTTRDVETVTPFTGDGTNNAATCAIALSPDNVTYSTMATISIAAALNLTGVLTDTVNVRVPAGWYLKLTAVHGTIGTTTYY